VRQSLSQCLRVSALVLCLIQTDLTQIIVHPFQLLLAQVLNWDLNRKIATCRRIRKYKARTGYLISGHWTSPDLGYQPNILPWTYISLKVLHTFINEIIWIWDKKFLYDLITQHKYAIYIKKVPHTIINSTLNGNYKISIGIT